MKKSFEITACDADSSARTGVIHTGHGPIQTPAFAPVASQGSVKALTHDMVQKLKAQIILVNAYHLYLRPGLDVIKKLEGVHSFISWQGPILSDSGGFQIYSLTPLAKVKDDGVEFSSHLDGSKIFLTPEDVIDIQGTLGTDIMMLLDYFCAYPASKKEARKAVEITTKWAQRSKSHMQKKASSQLLWGICQGGIYWDLRRQSIEELMAIDFDGYALGGLGIGEPKTHFMEMVERSGDILPKERPRYLMGIGYVKDILQAVEKGIDFFDCVLPTRNARNGTLFTSAGKIVIKNKKYEKDGRPVDEACGCYTCRNFSRAYLRHLYERQEITSSVLNTLHNLHFYLDIFRKIRHSIQSNSFRQLKYSIMNKKEEDELV